MKRSPNYLLLAIALAVDASAAATPAPSFASCFVLQPGVELATSSSHTRIESARYDNRDVIAVSVTLSDEHGGGTVVQYHDPGTYRPIALESTGMHGLGIPAGEVRIPDAEPYPDHVARGTKVQSTGMPLAQRLLPFDATITFVGFATIELPLATGPRTFEHTCHLQMSVDDARVDYWYASGLGVIRTDFATGDGPVQSNPVTSIREGI